MLKLNVGSLLLFSRMSDRDQSVIAVDGRADPSINVTNGRYPTSFAKKRAFYGKNHNKQHSVPEVITTDPDPPAKELNPVTETAGKRQTPPLPCPSPVIQQASIIKQPTVGLLLPECLPNPVTFGEHLYLECTILKNNLLLLREALGRHNGSGLEMPELFHVLEDIRRAKEELDRKVSRPLGDLKDELDRRLTHHRQAAASAAAAAAAPTDPRVLRTPFTASAHFIPTQLHPFPPHYFASLWTPAGPPPTLTHHPSDLIRPSNVSCPSDSSGPYVPVPSLSAQPAH